MMLGTQLRPVAPYDEASIDLMPYMEQLQSSLTLVARAIVQLDKRIARLEEQVLARDVQRGWSRNEQPTWRKS